MSNIPIVAVLYEKLPQQEIRLRSAQQGQVRFGSTFLIPAIYIEMTISVTGCQSSK